MGEENQISPEVRTLIMQRIDSVMQLELLLLMHADVARVWTAHDVARELRIDASASKSQLNLLVSRQLLAQADTPPDSYQYKPASPQLESSVNGLAHAYGDRRVTVISLIYSKPTDTLRSFADAFRFRKEKDDG